MITFHDLRVGKFYIEFSDTNDKYITILQIIDEDITNRKKLFHDFYSSNETFKERTEWYSEYNCSDRLCYFELSNLMTIEETKQTYPELFV